jgi:cytoskeletal protein CcmA (bactofilin family)
VTEPASESVVCAVAAGAAFEGLLSFWGEARVDGSLRGEVAARGRLELGAEAHVAARIEVDVLVVAGTVEGEIIARERVEVLAGAQVRASIRTPRLALAEGASFEGRLEMSGAGSPAPARTSKSAASAA